MALVVFSMTQTVLRVRWTVQPLFYLGGNILYYTLLDLGSILHDEQQPVVNGHHECEFFQPTRRMVFPPQSNLAKNITIFIYQWAIVR